MEEQLISFETAKLAQKKGFNELCLYHFRLNAPVGEQFYTDRCATKNSQWEMSVTAPTQSLLQKWLREKHNLHAHAVPHKDHAADVNDPVVYRVVVYGRYAESKEYKIYEECLEDALFIALKLVPDGKETN